MKCFRCGEVGHRKANCKKTAAKKILFVDTDECDDYDAEIEGEAVYDEEAVDVFNVKHLIPFTGDSSDDDTVLNSRSNFLSPRENDVDQAALDFLDRFDRVQVYKRASTGSNF